MSRPRVRVVRAALAVAGLLGGFTLASSSSPRPVSADAGEFIRVYYDRDQVQGLGWGFDISVDVAVGGVVRATAPVTNTMFMSSLNGVVDIVPGMVVTATGTTTGFVKSVLVAGVSVTTFDVPSDLVIGTVNPAVPLSVCLGDATLYGCADATPALDGSFTADLGAVGLDIRPGMSGEVHVPDSDGDRTTVGLGVPNPMVEAWWAAGLAVRGFTPNSDVVLTLDDTHGNVGTWTVRTDGTGFSWGGGLPPGWDHLEPGWIGSATGPVEHRELAVLTKTTTVLADFPNITETTVSGTLAGVVTDDRGGAGSRVEVIATCAEGSATRQLVADPTTGAFFVDFTVPVGPPNGWGECTAPIITILIRYYDRDGDMSQPWWVRVPAPQMTADPSTDLFDGQMVQLQLEGWDLNQVVIEQCELVAGEPGECDPATAWRTLTYPPSNWPLPPYAGGEFSRQVHRFLQLSGGHTVDCAAAPESCAFVATELYRPGPLGAWVALTFTPVVPATVSVMPAIGLSDGQSVTVTGTGFTNGAMLIMCRGNRNGDGGWCDTSTITGDFPVDQAGDFTTDYTMARHLSTPNGWVDCGAANGTCDLVAFDPGDPFGRNASASLTFAPPLGPINVSVKSSGTVSKVSGWAVVSGTVRCSDDVPVSIEGSLWQRIDRRHVAQGGFATSVACIAGRTVTWTATVVPQGMPIVPFVSGAAQVTAHAEAQRYAETTSADLTAIVKLANARK